MSNDPNDYPKFFALSVKEGKKEELTVFDVPYLLITNVCLNIPIDTTSFLTKPTRLFAHCQTRVNNSNQTEESAIIQTQLSSICIATLIPQRNEHCSIQFKLLQNEKVEFEVIGPYQVDIIGYYSTPEFLNTNSDEEMLKRLSLFYEEEEEEEEQMINSSDLEKEAQKQHSMNEKEGGEIGEQA